MPFFYNQPLTRVDKFTLFIYTILTLALIGFYLFNKDDSGVWLMGYAVLTQLFSFFFLYVALRNAAFFLVVYGFGLIHLIMYFLMVDHFAIQTVNFSYLATLRNTIVLLTFFQVLRWLSIKIQNREFVVPTKGGDTDLIENKKTSFADYVFLFIYIGAWGGLSYLSITYP
jgi:hypothetical protein